MWERVLNDIDSIYINKKNRYHLTEQGVINQFVQLVLNNDLSLMDTSVKMNENNGRKIIIVHSYVVETDKGSEFIQNIMEV